MAEGGDLYVRMLITAKDQASEVWKGLTENLGGVGKAALGVGAAVAVVGGLIAVAVHMAGDFQEGLTLLKTAGGETAANMQMVGDGIKALAVTTGDSTDALEQSMLKIEASGQHGAAGLDELTAAAEGAKVSGDSLTGTTSILTTTMKAYQIDGTNAAGTMNLLNAAALAGHVQLQDLGSSMQRILPAAKSAGIALPEVAAGMASLTDTGMKATMASSSLRTIITTLETPSKSAAAAMTGLGLNTAQVAAEMRKQPDGMISVMQELSVALAQKFPNDAAVAAAEFAKVKAGTETVDTALVHLTSTTSPQYQAALKAIAGSSQNVAALSALTGANLITLDKNFKLVTDASKSGKDGITGWDEAQKDFNTELERAHEAMNVLAITVGQQLLPPLSALIGKIADGIGRFAAWLENTGLLNVAITILGDGFTVLGQVLDAVADVLERVVTFFMDNRPAAIALAAALAGVTAAWLAMNIQAAFSTGGSLLLFFSSLPTRIGLLWLSAAATWANVAAWIALNWPILAIGAVVAAVVAIVILAVTHWGQIVAWLQGVWAAFSSWFMGLWNAISSFVGGVMSAIGTAFRTAWDAIVGTITGVLNAIGTAIRTAWNAIVSVLTTIWNAILTIAKVIFAVIAFIILAPFIPLFLLIRNNWTAISAFLTTLWTTIKTVATTVWNAIAAFFTTVLTAIQTAFTTVWNFIVALFTTVLTAIRAAVTTAFTAVWSFIVSIWNTIWGAITTAWANIKAAIAGALSAVWSVITGAAAGLLAAVTTPFTNAWNAIVGIWTTIKNAIAGALSGVWNTITGWAGMIWNALTAPFQNAYNSIVGIVSDIWNAVKNAPVIGGIIQWAGGQSGVTNWQGGPLWVGEAGRELIWLPQGGAVTSHAQSEQMAKQMQTSGAPAPGRSAVTSLVQAGAGGVGGGATELHMHIHTQQLSEADMNRAVSYLGDKLRAQFGNSY